MDRVTSKRHGPPSNGEVCDHWQGRGFPSAVGPEDGDGLTLAGLDVDGEQDGHPVVTGLNALEFQHGASPPVKP